MKTIHLTSLAVAITVFLAACGSLPTSTALLDQTRIDYLAAESNPAVATYASLELHQASDALSKANMAAQERQGDDKVDALAYLAKQKIALTQEMAKQKLAEAQVAMAGKERDQIQLAQRTNEADQAKMMAENAKMMAENAKMATRSAQNETAMAQGEAVDAQRQTVEAQAHAAQLAAQLAELSAQKTERGMVITIGDVLFGLDRSSLTAQGLASIDKLALVMQQNPERTVMVEGFTDSTGTTAYNQTLSEQRAQAVGTALQQRGIGTVRITTRGFGETNPVASNGSASERQLNRRVEIVLSDESGKIARR